MSQIFIAIVDGRGLGVLAVGVGLGVVAYLLSGYVIARRFLYSDHHTFPATESPESRGLSAEQFRFSARNDHEIAGWIIRPQEPLAVPNACVVMVHGYDSGKDRVWTFSDDPTYRGSMLDQGAASLAHAGFHVAAIDLRGHGESDDYHHVTLGYGESFDVLDTIAFLTHHAEHFGIDVHRIGVRGESMGGSTAMIAAAHDEHGWIKSLWIDSVYADARQAISDFIHHAGVPRVFSPAVRFFLHRMTSVPVERASPVNYVQSIRCPTHLVHSRDDTMIPHRHLERLHSSAHWCEPPAIWSMEGHEHNRLWRHPDYHQRQIQFFLETL